MRVMIIMLAGAFVLGGCNRRPMPSSIGLPTSRTAPPAPAASAEASTGDEPEDADESRHQPVKGLEIPFRQSRRSPGSTAPAPAGGNAPSEPPPVSDEGGGSENEGGDSPE